MDIRRFFTRFGISNLNKDETLAVCDFLAFEHLCALKSVNSVFHRDRDLYQKAISAQRDESYRSDIIKVGTRIQLFTPDPNGDGWDADNKGTVFKVECSVNEGGNKLGVYSIAWDEEDGRLRTWDIKCSGDGDGIQRLVKYDHW